MKVSGPLRTGCVVCVRWLDAWSNIDWYDDISEPDILNKMKMKCELEDVGFYLGKKDGYLLIAQDRGPGDDDYRHAHYIPLGNIISIDILRNKRML